MKSFILAGGFATRLWPLTERRAKPLLPIAGEPLLTHLIKRIPQDISVTVSTNAVFARDMQTWAAGIKDRAIVEILIEDSGHDDRKLGALGAVAKWIKDAHIDEDILLLAGDNYLSFDLQQFIGAFRGHPLLAAHDIGDLEQAKAFGTVIVSDAVDQSPVRTVTAFEEKPEHPRSTCVSTGCYLLPRTSLRTLAEFAKTHPDNIGGVFEEFLRYAIQVDAFVFPELWQDIGSFQSYLSLHCALMGGKQLTDPSAFIGSDTRLAGSVVIGPGTTVQNSKISDSILFGHSVIDDCVIDRCIIDEGCDLKGVDLTGKMIRAGTVLKQKAEM